jgi:DNA processing protein
VDDVLEVLRPMLGGTFQEPDAGSAPPAEDVADSEAARIRRGIEEALGPAPVAIDELIRLCAAPAAAVLTIILELELAGKVARHPGNKVSWG